MAGSDDAPFPQPVLDGLQEDADRPAFEQGSRTVSRGVVLRLIRRAVGELRAAGIGPGRGVAMATAVSPEAFAAMIAAHVRGCRVVGVRPGYPPRQLAHVLGAGIDAIVVDAATATDELLAAAAPAAVLHLDALLDGPDDEPLTLQARPEDVARLVYTSGSTGLPKGCVQTYGAMTERSFWQPQTWSAATARLAACMQRHLLFGTLSSPVVMDHLGLSLLSGGTGVIPDDGERLFPDAIARHRITATIMTVPRLYQMLDTLRATPFDVSSLRAVMVAGSPLMPHRLAEAVEMLGPVMFQAYGLSETGSLAMLTPEDIADHGPDVLSSAGRPHSHVEVSIRDGGEIYVRPYLMSGYWNDPEETAAVLEDGWLRTRDLGYLDDKGFLHLTGRARDTIMVNALPHYAGPIERALAGHPDVDQAYVVGAPDDETGEAIHAFLIAAPGRTPDRAALAELVRAELGADSVPKTITIVPDVPIAPSGKPDKRALLARMQAARPA